MPNPAPLPPTRPTDSGTRALLERGLDSSSGLGFVRERLALLGKTLFLVSFGFYLFLLASLVLIGGAPFGAVARGPVALGHLCASLTMALLWLLASRARLSLWSLGALDAVSFVLAGGFLSLMTLEDEGQILQTLLALTVTVMVRAILRERSPVRIDPASRGNYSYYMASKELKVARIGNSRGIRIPAGTLERYRIGATVVMEERSDGILLRPAGRASPKLSWEETAREMAAHQEDWTDWETTVADGLLDLSWETPKPRRVAEHGPGYRGGSRRKR